MLGICWVRTVIVLLTDCLVPDEGAQIEGSHDIERRARGVPCFLACTVTTCSSQTDYGTIGAV